MPHPIITLQAIRDRGLAYGHEHEVIARAMEAFGLNVRDLECDHPLIDLYQALLFSAPTNDIVYLSERHLPLLEEAIERMRIDAIDRLRRQATADRLRLMLRRSAVYADECGDVELALEVLGFDILKENGGELAELYRDLLADDPRGEPRSLSQAERTALMRAARVMVMTKDEDG